MRAWPLISSLIIVGCTAIEYADGGTPSAGGAGGDGAGGDGAGGITSEVCGNGIDDEPDGATDCEDPDCASTCAVPAGWTGPVAIEEGGCDDAAPGAAGLRAIASADGDADCACACDDEPECESVHLELFAGAGCTGGGDDGELESQCVELLTGTDALRVTVTASCGAPQALLVEPEPSVDDFWLCTAPTGTCIYRSGGHDCPSSFPNASVVATNLVDTRGCEAGACSCEPHCGTVMLFSTPTCTVPVEVIEPGACENLVGNNLAVQRQDDPEVCLVGGAPTSTGSISLTDAITICCE